MLEFHTSILCNFFSKSLTKVKKNLLSKRRRLKVKILKVFEQDIGKCLHSVNLPPIQVKL